MTYVKKKSNLFPIPKLIFENWKWVAIDGLPTEDWRWCLIMWRDYKGDLDIHVGSYYKELKEFYVDFGRGGTVLSADHVVGWTTFRDCKWEIPDRDSIPCSESKMDCEKEQVYE